jgi:DNA-binding NtrC family response regulator/tetratricopeptide (TPR) repeat protein
MATRALLEHPRYEPGEELGRGGQGMVLGVVDREAPDVALVAKVFAPREGLYEDALAAEFAVLARARIPGLARAHDLARCTRTGAPFLVEERVDGPDAAAWVGAPGLAGPVRAARLAKLVADVAATLSQLHDAGFAHGDLKPAHARVAARVVLLDLGAALAIGGAEGPRALTPAFAAPEILAGARASPLADLFGLGALTWASAAGSPPERGKAPRLRALAPWVPPSLADLVEALVAPHPRDRPQDAREVLQRVGVAHGAAGLVPMHPPPPIGRERELAAVGRLASGVYYLTGSSGTGKSHLAREVATRTLLAGRSVRHLRFPSVAGPTVAGLIAFFRGNPLAFPFRAAGGDAPLLLVLDDLHLAPAEIRDALQLYRCRGDPGAPRSAAGHATAPKLAVLATDREAPDGADACELGPLDERDFTALCRSLGIHDGTRIAAARAASGGSPGWLVASVGAVPLTRDTALERTRVLSEDAAGVLAAIALAAGEASLSACRRVAGPGADDALAKLVRASLIDRRGSGYVLTAPALAHDLALLATHEVVDRMAQALLDEPAPRVAALLSVAAADTPPARRAELLARAAEVARAEGSSTEEIDALFGLAADPVRRAPELLVRLERLVRDTGVADLHPRVLSWLDEAAASDARLLPLALRRRAEKAARDGDHGAARALCERAGRAAAGDPVAEALVLATRGKIALFAASYGDAEGVLEEACSRLAALPVDDVEEVARVDHNLGVVALHRGRPEEAAAAFERSIAVKRLLGDRTGMRACLLNLGIAEARRGALDDADRALSEALLLSRALGQTTGRAWVLAALADVAVRRGDAAAADRRLGEAAALADALPAMVRAHLVLVEAQVALLRGDGNLALAALGALDPGARETDALLGARALTIEASAVLARLPVDRRAAARRAVQAVRRARDASLGEAEAEARAVLRAARTPGGSASYLAGVTLRAPPEDPNDEAVWGWLGELGAGGAPERAVASLAALVARASGAERAFIVAVDATGNVEDAWGADLDGLPIAEPRARVPLAAIADALAGAGPVYLRDVAGARGRGSRLAVAGPEGLPTRAVVLLEHRFAEGAFDGARSVQVSRWATLAALALRANAARVDNDGVRQAAPPPALLPVPEISTAFPLLEPTRSFPGIVGESQALRRALARVEAATLGDLPVLIVGETGSGKEVFARALHDLGPRARRPFVAVNCGAVSESLFEAEFFGHARGSFTGADRARPGLLGRVNGGTLFLDEIGELPLARQATLLRALQERRYRPVGGDEELAFEARVVAATNRDLERAVAAREFRQDLFYRLNAVEIRVPPLRERAEDVPELARTFLARAGSQAELAPDALRALTAYAWPGNVRELEHAMTRAAQLGVPVIGRAQLPRAMRAELLAPEAPQASHALRGASLASAETRGARRERAEVERALARSGGNISRAAALLGLTRQGLKKRMVRLGMRAPKGAVGSSPE